MNRIGHGGKTVLVAICFMLMAALVGGVAWLAKLDQEEVAIPIRNAKRRMAQKVA